MPKVKFVRENKTIDVNSGTNIRKLAKQNDVPIYRGMDQVFNCHGLGLCGTCVIEIEDQSGVSPKRRGEDKILTKKGMNGSTRRLACQCQVFGKKVEVTTLG